MIEKTYNVGIYCRLSNDDERDGESVSIENQKLLLQSYVRQRGWNEIAVYCDDGYSGTNFDRPGVKRLIEDAKAKKINLILVKDLSRFGRNYIEFGQYTDYLFPSLGCRFIALNNGIDTMSDNGSTDVMCFLNLFNEFYSRDTSKKVKAVKRACAESGKFMGTYPAYGYKRDPEDKHHLVIDEETAPMVRRIFAMRAAGTGFRAIAVTLNEEGVLPPGALYYQRKGRSDPRNVNHKWAETTVKALIRSEVYIGNMVQGKTGTLSYKSRKLINKPEEEWIRVEGTHEPIISREVWDTVVSIDKKKVRKTPPTDGIRSIFTGLVYCADCGFKMRNHIERFTYKDGTPGRYSSFICGNYARSGKSACTIHSIYENVLEELVLTDIREKARFVECDGERLAEQISRMKEKESRSRVTSYEQELKAAAARMIELERLMQNLYEDKCTGTIPQTVFQTLMQKYETERAEKASAIPELEQKVRAQLENRQDANRWMEVIRRYTEITVLDESILGRAAKRGYIETHCHQIRDYTLNRQKQVDDYPYGGGPGMVMQAQPIYDCCVDVIRQMEEAGHARPHVVFMTAAGTPLTEEKCKQLAQKDSLLLVCGHYEGIDERVIEALADEEISIGDYVLTGGELAALVVADSVCRLCPGVLSSPEGYEEESHYSGLLEYPQYSRPEEWNGRRVPEILLSGHHANIAKWRHEQALERTRTRRPDLYEKYEEKSMAKIDK